MPYRRLPTTDKTRLYALKTLIENDDIYTVRDRFLNWKDINDAHTAYDRLLTVVTQYELDKSAQARGSKKISPLQRNAMLYVSHFMSVLKMCVERGEIKRSMLQLYGLPTNMSALPNLQTAQPLIEWGGKIIEGEKLRIKKGGRPIYNPTISMVNTHFEIFMDAYAKQKSLQKRTRDNELRLMAMRPEIDALILRIWNQVEQHFNGTTVAERMESCKKYGIIYYLRRKERKKEND